MARRKYSDELKLQVMAALMSGQSITKAAEDFDIPESTIGNWSAKLNQAGIPIVPLQKKEEIGGRLIDLINKMLDTQMAMLEVMGEKEYLRKQDLAELGMAFGVNNDKLDRILARLSNAADNQTPPD
jgi:transposase-like protein